MANTASDHRWRFFRAGGVDQVRIDRGGDLASLDSLDLKNWVALSCPVKGLDFDERTLTLLDGDQDGRIRAPEIQEAVRWVCRVLKDPDVVLRAGDRLDPAWIQSEDPVGAAVLATVRRVNQQAGREPDASIDVAQAMAATQDLAKAPLNGDGVVPPASIEDETLRAVAEQVRTCVGEVPDRSGEPGIDAPGIDRFFDELAAYAAWMDAAAQDAANVLPLGDGTAAAMDAVRAVAAKVEDYFARCRLAAFDSRAVAAMNRSEDDLKAMAAMDLTTGAPAVAALPLARVEPDRALPLASGVNPAWAAAVSTLRATAVEPLLGPGKTSLTAAEWEKLRARLAAFDAWQAAKAGACVEALGLERVRELLASDAKAGLHDWVARDLALEPEMAALIDVERLARYLRDLPELLDNYVAFGRFYGARDKAVFQAGTLFIDGRACDLCLNVFDPGKHATLAGLSRMYLVYCDCTRPSGERRTIVGAVTNGHADNLMVGRNGVFYDRKGRDWDATITKIVENPISLRQAFWAPYKKFLRMIEDMVAKRAAAADAEADKRMASAAEATATADKAAGSPPPAPKKIDVGTVAAIGVAVGGITAALGALLGTFFGLGFWMPLGIVGLVLLISGPSVLIAWLKLRQRNIGPLLDASGWAINALTRVNTPFGASLTSVASIPKGAERSMSDPFRQKRRVWPWIVAILLVLGLAAWGLHRSGHLGRWIGYGDKPEATVTVTVEATATTAAPAPGPAAEPAAAEPAP